MAQKHRIVSSLFWRLIERSLTQLIQVVLQIILARLLNPTIYGTMDILLIFVNVSSIIIQNGFTVALIQNKEVTRIDYSSVLWLNLGISSLLYVILYFSAPAIANHFQDLNFTQYLRVLALILFPGAITAVQNAIVSREMLFKKMFYRSVIVSFISGSVGITAAFFDMGVWSLVLYNLVASFTLPLLMFIWLPWRPSLTFSRTRIKELFGISWKVLFVAVLNTLYSDLRSLLIGYDYSTQELAYYNRGQMYPSLIITNISYAVSSVLLPAFSHIQDETKQIKALMQKSISLGAMIIAPCLIGFAAVAPQFVSIFLTDKWLPAAPYIRVFCIYRIPYFVHSVTLQAVNAKGRTDMYLKTYIISNLLNLLVLLITIKHGTMAIAIGAVAVSYIRLWINSVPCKRLFDYPLAEQFRDFAPHLGRSLIMGAVVVLFGTLDLPAGVSFFLMILLGITIYVLLIYITDRAELNEVKIIVSNYLKRR